MFKCNVYRGRIRTAASEPIRLYEFWDNLIVDVFFKNDVIIKINGASVYINAKTLTVDIVANDSEMQSYAPFGIEYPDDGGVRVTLARNVNIYVEHGWVNIYIEQGSRVMPVADFIWTDSQE